MNSILAIGIVIVTATFVQMVEAETEALAQELARKLRPPTQEQTSRCCDYVGRFCNQRKEKCADFTKPKTNVRTCKCITTLEYKIKVFLDKCFRKADKRIALRIKKELSRMVLKKLPLRTLGSEKTKYYHPGKQAGTGAKKPSKVNKQNTQLDSVV